MVTERNPGITADVLFVGATRPAMRWGVTYAALIVNALVSMEAFLLSKNLLMLLVALPLHAVSLLLCARDARCFELLALWAWVHLPQWLRTRRRWQASSYGALAVDAPSSAGRRSARPSVLP
ncbi:MAG: VirB3 family type IV secretion system protein [Pseudomonadota bacterium]